MNPFRACRNNKHWSFAYEIRVNSKIRLILIMIMILIVAIDSHVIIYASACLVILTTSLEA